MSTPWSIISDESRRAFRGDGAFPIIAYSERMPPPWIWPKPAEAHQVTKRQGDGWEVCEHEEHDELAPGLDRVASELVSELDKLTQGRGSAFSRTLLADNPAWPAELDRAAKAGELRAPVTVLLPLALSRTQDDKGRVRWTLFGASHDGPARAFWRSVARLGAEGFGRLLEWAAGDGGARVIARGPDPLFPAEEELPEFARGRVLGEGEALGSTRAILTFRPFGRLPAVVRQAYLAGTVALVPSPASLVFFEHQGYRRLAERLPRAMQIPLLHLFARSEAAWGLRTPQSGWLDEGRSAGAGSAGHRIVRAVVRSHRWQRVARDAVPDERFADPVATTLFSSKPEDLGLYGKPMAQNAQIWSEDYALVLDGPTAPREALEAAAAALGGGGRFGYRLYYPPMRAGVREVFWHRPLAARATSAGAERAPLDLLGYLTAERDGAPALELTPRLLDRAGHREAARLSERDPGLARGTTARNARRLLEWSEHLGPLDGALARRLLQAAEKTEVADWLSALAARDEAEARALAVELGRRLAQGTGEEEAPGLTLAETRGRDFEERYWRQIAALAEGELREKDNADVVSANAGKTGGPAALRAGRAPAARRDLEPLAALLARAYQEKIARHGMAGRAQVAEHVFRWETAFDLSWSEAWVKNQIGALRERNVVCLIPGRDRSQAVIMGDHYDTAYMEDLYEAARGGDGLRAAAAGADDNHSATAALLLAADVLLPLAREGKLARDVWLVHLTGEEFPADCLGARALVSALVQGTLRLRGPRGELIDKSGTRCVAAFILDMIAHNNERARDVFQIAPGEGAAAARLALRAHHANERWNAAARRGNQHPARAGKGRARRMPDGREPPPIAEHLELRGEVRPEWDPRSALFNTDGQIFSDAGLPVVLFMENYDISRQGYHDTEDTMKNIDLDYGAALAAIAIETVADCAAADAL